MPLEMLQNIDFSLSSIVSGLLFGIIGMWLFGQGKKSSNLKFIGIGLALMVYPYFTRGPLADWGVGSVLCVVAYYYRYEI